MAKVLSRTLTARTDLGLAFGLVVLFLMALTLSSCNTVEGMGEDVSAAGGAVSDTADDVEDEM
jgi:predicted small secreted protein